MKRSILLAAMMLIGVSLLAINTFVKASDPALQDPARAAVPAAHVGPQTASPAKVLLDVQGMSCGGCVSTIQSALSKMDGVSDVQVDVAAGTATVAYDPQTLRDRDMIARAITDSGYPARMVREMSADQVREVRQVADARAATVIASVDGFDIPRADFEADLAHAKSRYQSLYGPGVFTDDRGPKLWHNLKGQIARQLITEGIQLREIQRAGFVVDKDRVDRELRSYLNQRQMTRDDFASALAANGFQVERFQKKFGNRVLIEAYIEEKVTAGATSAAEKQQRYADWFDNARLLAEVVIYDRDLAALEKSGLAGGSCGSSCNAEK